jgi:hypothetical protein
LKPLPNKLPVAGAAPKRGAVVEPLPNRLPPTIAFPNNPPAGFSLPYSSFEGLPFPATGALVGLLPVNNPVIYSFPFPFATVSAGAADWRLILMILYNRYKINSNDTLVV